MSQVARRHRFGSVACGLVLCSVATARADYEASVMAGPVIGIRLGATRGSRLAFGLEGGAGLMPSHFPQAGSGALNGTARLNIGFERSGDRLLAYIELDPWLLVGGTLGVGLDDHGVVPVVGAWEGVPLIYQAYDCDPLGGWGTALTAAFGYRFTGEHELYLTVKAGAMQNIHTDGCH
jgi:hypothetical protein